MSYPDDVIDALEVLEGRLNRELPRNWRSSYDYDADPLVAVMYAWHDAGLELSESMAESEALDVLDYYTEARAAVLDPNDEEYDN